MLWGIVVAPVVSGLILGASTLVFFLQSAWPSLSLTAMVALSSFCSACLKRSHG